MVITIIVLLILAAISIATLTGQNGVLIKANTAKEKTEMARLKEEAELVKQAEYIDVFSDKDRSNKLQKFELLKKLNTYFEGSILKDVNIVDAVEYQSNWILRGSDGKLYVSGNNPSGQLGNGTKLEVEDYECISDIPESPLYGVRITDIKMEYSAVIARDGNGKVYTWGANGCGQLGNGNTEVVYEPVCISDISGSALKGKNIVEIDFEDAVIARDENGKIYTWGSNSAGQLGNGTTGNGTLTNDSAMPICISDISGNPLRGVKIDTINAFGIWDSNNTIIVKDLNGNIYGWGRNSKGELTDGTTNNILIPRCINNINGTLLNGLTIKKMNTKVIRGTGHDIVTAYVASDNKAYIIWTSYPVPV